MFDWLEIIAMCCSAMLFGFLLGSTLTEISFYRRVKDNEPIDLTPKGGKR